MWKRYLAFVMTMVLILHFAPTAVYAEEGVEPAQNSAVALEAEEEAGSGEKISGSDKQEQTAERQNDGSEQVQPGESNGQEKFEGSGDSGATQLGEDDELEPAQPKGNDAQEKPEESIGEEPTQSGENTEVKPEQPGQEEIEQPEENAGQVEDDGKIEEETEAKKTGDGESGEEQTETESDIAEPVYAVGDTGEYQPEGASYQLTYTVVDDGVKITGITGMKEGELKIPATIGGMDVVEIGDEAFSDCDKLTGQLVIPDKVCIIGRNAFEGCTGFSGRLVFPEVVEEIKYGAFKGCTGFSGQLVIPDKVSWIHDYVFENCNGFSGKLVIPNSARYVDWYAFSGCNNISEIEIQEKISTVSRNAFTHDGSIKRKIYVFNSEMSIGENGLGDGDTIYGYAGSTAEIYVRSGSTSTFVYLDGQPEVKEYRVKNTEELINALGSHRKIVLADGVYDLYGNPYNDTAKYLEISSKIGLSIEAEHPGKVELLLHNNNNPVVKINNSVDISISGCILGHESEGEELECGDDGSVVSVWSSGNVKISKCDLYGCGVWGVSTSRSSVSVEGSVIRDCVKGITNGDDISLKSCIFSGNAYKEAENRPPAFYGENVSVSNCTFMNNYNPTLFFQDTYHDYTGTVENCTFYNNVWDGETVSDQSSGIDLNGITWQLDGTVLKLGYPLELDKGTIESKTGKVMDYSSSAAPWKNCEFTEVQYAEGIEKPDKEITSGGSDPTDPVESIKLDKDILILFVDETVTLTAKITPDTAVAASVTWSSSDTSVATVQNGFVTAVSAGECTITASAGGKSATCDITVMRDHIGDIASGKYGNLTWRIDGNGKLTVNGEHEFALIVISDYYDEIHYTRAPWYEYRDKIISAEINVRYMNDASYMFYGCTNLTSVDFRYFDTSRLGSMYGMFMDCKSLKTLDLSNLDTGQVHHMGSMFSGCNRLTDLKLGNLDTSQVMDMNSMFESCSSLTSLDLSSFDVSNVSTMDSMFWECSALTDLNLSNFNTSNQLMYIADMFSGCSSLVELDLSSFDGSGVRDFLSFFGDDNTFSMFEGCNSLTTIYTPYNLMRRYQLPGDSGDIWYQPDGSEITILPTACDSMRITKNRVPDVYNPYIKATIRKTDYVCGDFIATRGLTVKYYGSDGTIKKVTDYTTNEDEIDMSTPGKKTLVVTYNGLSAEIGLNVSEARVERILLDEDSLTLSKGEMSILHADVFPKSALSLPVTWSSSDPSIAKVLAGPVHDAYVTGVSGGECTVTVSAGDKSATCLVTVTDNQTEQPGSDIAKGSYGDVEWRINADGKLIVEGSGEFAGSGSTIRAPWYQYSSSIKSAEINLTGTTNVSYMFYDCRNITDIDVSKFDTSNVTNMTGTFRDCNSLVSLDLSACKTENMTMMEGIFSGCGSLTSINLSSFDMQKVTQIADFFKGCQKLSTIYAPCNLKMSVELPRGSSTVSDNSTISGNSTAFGDIWYDIDGNTYTELPRNLSRSIVLTRNQKPVISEPYIILEKGKIRYVIGEKLNTDDLKVIYYNETGISSRVNDYTTNANEIDMSTPGTKTLVVTYRDLHAEIKITVIEKQTEETPETKGLKITFKNEQDRESVYTGSAIKPEIKVSYNGRSLVEGTNYTVKYANNVKAGYGRITVTGKGNFRSTKTQNFTIVRADIANAELAGTDKEGRLVVASGSKFAPIIYYGSQKLTAKDYSISGAVMAGKKITDSDSNKVVTIKGRGNYTGDREIVLRVVRKSDLTKFTVTLDQTKLNALTYDGRGHYIHDIQGALTVIGKDGNTHMKRGMDYMIVYPANVTDAGVKKFSVVGMGLYTGAVSKSYTIKPAVDTYGALKVEYVSGSIDNIKLPYRSTGVTFNEKLKITDTQNEDTFTLREGKDYKVTYSGNKKIGSNAKFTISFLGNYKGIQKQTRTFTIEKADLKDAAVVIADAVYKKNPGIYKSIPYVIEQETGRLIKASNYHVTYYVDENRNREMKGQNKVSSGDTVYVKIEAKPNSNYKSDMPLIQTYRVTNAIDLSKAKITFVNAETGTAAKSAEYTGQKITDREIKVLVDGKPADENMIVTYADNIDKGQATVIVTGTGEPGCRYTGCKKAAFSIVAYSLR